MPKMTGIVEATGQNKSGYWAMKINGDWYSTYKDDPTPFKNQEVTFEFDKKGNFNNVKGKPVVVAAPAASAGRGGGVSGDARQQSIVLQSSYKTAVDIVSAALAADAIGLGSKKADKLGIILGAVDEVALSLYNKCIDPAAFLAGVDEDEDFEEYSEEEEEGYSAVEA